MTIAPVYMLTMHNLSNSVPPWDCRRNPITRALWVRTHAAFLLAHLIYDLLPKEKQTLAANPYVSCSWHCRFGSLMISIGDWVFRQLENRQEVIWSFIPTEEVSSYLVGRWSCYWLWTQKIHTTFSSSKIPSRRWQKYQQAFDWHFSHSRWPQLYTRQVHCSKMYSFSFWLPFSPRFLHL